MIQLFGVATYLIGLIMMVTMVLESVGMIDRTNPIATVLFLVFGYILCVTGYLFVRRASPYT